MGINWTIWLILAGRGFGKTRTGAEWIISRASSGTSKRFALVGETTADVRDVMVEGNSGIMNCSPPWFRPAYVPSKRRLVWPNGAVAFTYSAEEPDQLRGPEHDAAWCDEIAKWRYPDTWDQLMFGLRMGNNPQVVATTTPRPVKIIRELLTDPTCVVTRGSTYDNKENLSKQFFTRVVSRYEGTRLGRQELKAEVLDDVPGALWERNLIDALRRKPSQITTDKQIELYGLTRALANEMQRITVNIDPATTSGEDSDETGLTVTGKGHDGHGYVLEDLSGRMTPNEWAIVAIAAYKRWGADRIIGEVNNGGDLIENNLRAVDEDVSYEAVHASKGKVTRAEPVSTLYEQKKVHHIGSFPELEDQMCGMTNDFDKKKAGYSPDRLDSIVWGFHSLFLLDQNYGIARHYKQELDEMKRKKINPDLIAMIAPQGMSTYYTRNGQKYVSNSEGVMMIPEPDVSAALRAGLTRRDS